MDTLASDERSTSSILIIILQDLSFPITCSTWISAKPLLWILISAKPQISNLSQTFQKSLFRRSCNLVSYVPQPLYSLSTTDLHCPRKNEIVHFNTNIIESFYLLIYDSPAFRTNFPFHHIPHSTIICMKTHYLTPFHFYIPKFYTFLFHFMPIQASQNKTILDSYCQPLKSHKCLISQCMLAFSLSPYAFTNSYSTNSGNLELEFTTVRILNTPIAFSQSPIGARPCITCSKQK